MENEQITQLITAFGIILYTFSIVIYLLQSWGLYMISKKLGDPYPWMAWIPVLNIYTMVKAGGKDGLWVLWIILGLFVFYIPGLILIIIVLSGISKRTGRGAWTTIGLLLVPFIMYPAVGSELKETTMIDADKTMMNNGTSMNNEL